MRLWIEFPEESRFARQPRDILYTPIFFANEPIKAHLRLDTEWRSTYGDNLEEQFRSEIKLVGKASLGFLSIGGRPLSSIDTRYAVPNLGFKPIYTLEILNLLQRVSLAGLDYDVEDGIRGGKVPFTFRLPTSTLEEIQQLASSLKVVTSDNISTMGFLQGLTPALIVSVQYMVIGQVMENDELKATVMEEIRIFASLSEEQIPKATDPAIVINPMAKFINTQVFSLNAGRNRRGSVPLLRRLSRTSVQEQNLMNIEVEKADPFTFTRSSDAAASKVTISLLCTMDKTGNTETPPTIAATLRWMMKSLTTLTLEPLEREEQQSDDFFHLRTKVFPSHKLKMQWSEWQRAEGSSESQTKWKSTQTVWLVKDITSGLTPSFVTPYLAHTYMLNLQLALSDTDTRMGRGLSSGAKHKVELEVPVQVRYDLGLVPSYEVDRSLPEYDYTLPEYEETVGGSVPDDLPADDESNRLPDLSNLNLNLIPTRSIVEDSSIPPRQLRHSRPNSPRHSMEAPQ